LHRDLHSFPTRRSSDLQYVVVSRMAADTVTTKRRSSLHNHEPRAGLRELSTLAFALALLCPHVALGADEQESNADKAKAEAEKRSEEHTSELQSRENLV